jgi:hypothetical protein
MKTRALLALKLGLLAPLVASAADFEGKVTMKVTGQRGVPPEMNFSIKKGFSRIDMNVGEGQSAAMILDQAKEQMTIIMPAQKMYMIQPVPKPNEAMGANSKDDVKLEKTGEKEKILGYDCEKYLAKSKEGVTEIWLTDQLGMFMGMGGGNPMGNMGGRRGGSATQAWEEALRGKDSFPLRVTTKSADGKDSFRMEATAIKKESIPDSLFVPPADYQDMGAMMRGMGMPGMPGKGR